MATVAQGNNTYVPNMAAAGNLRFEFSRNPKSFALNRYAAIRGVKQMVGNYLSFTAEEAARITDLNKYHWADGNDAPKSHDSLELFSFEQYACQRYAFPFTLGNLAREQAAWDIDSQSMRVQAQKAMTFRSTKAANVLTTAGNWSGNTGTAASVGGGVWLNSSTTNQYILKTFRGVQETIFKNTLGAVSPESLICVISPDVAKAIRTSPEVIDFVKQQASAPAILMQNDAQYTRWGIPSQMYGIKIVVDDTVRVTSKKGATLASSYTLYHADGYAIFLTLTELVDQGKVGEDDLPAGGLQSFDTLSIFTYEDMVVEQREDVDNKRLEGRVIDNFAAVLTAPKSGYFITNVLQ